MKMENGEWEMDDLETHIIKGLIILSPYESFNGYGWMF